MAISLESCREADSCYSALQRGALPHPPGKCIADPSRRPRRHRRDHSSVGTPLVQPAAKPVASLPPIASLHFLGSFRIIIDGKELDVPLNDRGKAGRRDIASVLSLLCHRGRGWQAYEAVLNALWPEAPDRVYQQQRLNRALHSLKHLLALCLSPLGKVSVIERVGALCQLDPDP